jgi:AcrR family transcriptional regulator
MARRKDHTREELKDLILKAAWDLIEKHGPPGLTARNIAKIIGYTPGTIYNVFKSMDDLIIHINGITLDKLYSALNGPYLEKNNQPVTSRLKKMAKLYHAFAAEYKPHWYLLFTYLPPEDTPPPQWYHEKIQGLFKPLESILEDIITMEYIFLRNQKKS